MKNCPAGKAYICRTINRQGGYFRALIPADRLFRPVPPVFVLRRAKLASLLDIEIDLPGERLDIFEFLFRS